MFNAFDNIDYYFLLGLCTVWLIRRLNLEVDIVFNSNGHVRHVNATGVVRRFLLSYAIFDCNDNSNFLLRILYIPGGDHRYFNGGIFNRKTNQLLDIEVLILLHHKQLHDPTYVSYYTHEPYIYDDGLNTFTPITLRIPAPNFAALWLFWALNIKIVSNSFPIVIDHSTNPSTIVLHGIAKDISRNFI